jgi:hypothetical protein
LGEWEKKSDGERGRLVNVSIGQFGGRRLRAAKSMKESHGDRETGRGGSVRGQETRSADVAP